MRIFHSKHQKLILQCYPPGKGIDKKPNPSELSYLLYYASTRRIKLEKVIFFLDRKTHSDVSRARAGNLQVTLSIISALIEKCSDNLNVFASLVCSILHSILSIKDLALCRSVLGTYDVFCSKLDGALFTGDKEFVDSFTKVSESLIRTGDDLSKQDGPNKLEWKMLALMASRHVFGCLGYNTKMSKKFIGLCIPILADTIHHNNTEKNLLSRLNSHVNIENENSNNNNGSNNQSPKQFLTRTVSSKSTAHVNQIIDEDFENGSVSPTDLSEESFRGLKVLFNTSLTSQIIEATKVVVKLDFNPISVDSTESPNENYSNWNSAFLEMCVTWIPVQLRFITLSALLNRLTSVSQQASAEATSYDTQFQYATYILGLVSSDVNMIGLSISDVIQQLLSLQSHLYLNQSTYLSTEQVKDLSLLYSNSICNLSSHIYYFDQVPDSIQEVLIKVDSMLDSVANANDLSSPVASDPNYPEKLTNLVVTLLEDISITLSLLKEKPSTITRNHANLDHWEMGLSLLSPRSEFATDESAFALSSTQIESIQLKFLAVFRNFVTNEMVSGDEEASAADVISTERLPIDLSHYLTPDHNQYISTPENFISHFLAHVNKIFDSYAEGVDGNPAPINLELFESVVLTLSDLLSVLGVNFISNFVPLFYHWQLSLNQSTYSEVDKIKDTVAYIIMHRSIQTLQFKYSSYLPDTYATSSPFYRNLLIDIQYRRLNDLWVGALEASLPPNVTVSDQEIENEGSTATSHLDEENGGVKFNSNKKSLQVFATGNAFTSKWINPQRSLILDFERRKGPDRSVLDLNRLQVDEDTSELSSSDLGAGGSGVINGDLTESDTSTTRQHANGLGLGTANDITSIHSGLMHNQTSFSKIAAAAGASNGGLNANSNANTTLGSDLSNGSIFTNDLSNNKYYNSPRVADLKDIMMEHKGGNNILRKPSASFAQSGSSASNGHISSVLSSANNGVSAGPHATFANTSTGGESVSTTPGSILSKQMATADVDSILGDLDSDGDSDLVV